MPAIDGCLAWSGIISAAGRILPNGHAMKLLLVRHGETSWNRDGRYQGRSDTPLSARGKRQAQALAERLAASDEISIVASP